MRDYAFSMLTKVFKVALVVIAIVLFVGDPFGGTFAALSEKKKS
jgi:hypothetical protein